MNEETWLRFLYNGSANYIRRALTGSIKKSIMNTASIDSSLNELDDSELISLIGEQKSRIALRTLYDRYRHSLGSFLRAKVNHDQLVDEIYNDVMLTIWHKAAGFRGESRVSTWIFGIAYRICLSEYRKQKRQPQSITEYDLDQIYDEKTMDLEPAHHADQLDRLKTALVRLSENHREVIELSYFYGHSIKEISNLTGCPQNTVKTRLFHARQKLIKALETKTVIPQKLSCQ